jgi:hypothetical protein
MSATVYFLGNESDLRRLGFYKYKKAWYKQVERAINPEKRSFLSIIIENTGSGFKMIQPTDINERELWFLREEDLLEEFK